MAEANGAAPPDDRRKRTFWLLSGGAASLLLPLAGLAYIHWADTRPVAGPEGASDVFEHHDGQGPVVPSQVTPNVAALSSGRGAAAKPVSSLDFIKADPEFAARAAAASAATAAAAPAAGAPTAASSATAIVPAVSAKQTPASGKKQFVIPKLQPGRGFTSFGSTGAGSAAAQQQGGAGAPNSQQQMLQNLPPGAQNNPEIQKYLQSQQGH